MDRPLLPQRFLPDRIAPPLSGYPELYFSLRALVKRAAGTRLRAVRWASTLFPAAWRKIRAPIPLGDVIGMVAVLAALTPRAAAVQVLRKETG